MTTTDQSTKERGAGPLTAQQLLFLQEAERVVSSAHTAVEALKSALGEPAAEVARLRERAEELEEKLREKSDMLSMAESESTFNKALLDMVLPDGVAALRDGTYETDEKIRLFARKISKRTLVELERMF